VEFGVEAISKSLQNIFSHFLNGWQKHPYDVNMDSKISLNKSASGVMAGGNRDSPP
jgi:hypothetical protein